MFKKLKRATSFFILGWNNYDFDWVYLLEVISFKLKRMEKEILKGYNASPEKELQSLRLCQKLIHRITTYEYDYHHTLHLKRWGAEYNNEWIKGPSFDIYIYPKVSEDDKEKCRLDLLEAFRKDEERKEKDIDLLFRIMAKYIRWWWD